MYDEQLLNKLIEIRRNLHKIPELEFCEFKTTEYIENILDELKIPHNRITETGTVGILTNGQAKKTILLRADIDALPITEQNDIEYKSRIAGCMHACGHDAHITCLLGAAMILKNSDFDGNVKLMFQPAEEGSGGALPMITAGLLEKPYVDAAVALHVEPSCKVGSIQLKNGSVMASPDDFKIVITGKGGHGARPEECVNPLTCCAEIVKRISTIVEDNFKDSSKSVVSVCTINGGTSNNIIPDSVEITGTARSLDNETRDKIEHLLSEYAHDISKRYNCKCEYTFNRLYPPLINDKDITDIVFNATQKISIVKNTEFLKKAAMLGDDFSYIAQRVPSSYFKLGVGDDVNNYPLHSSKFNINEQSLLIGAKLLAQTVIEYFSKD